MAIAANPMPAWLFVTLYGALELYLGVAGTQEDVAHFGHFGGILGAWLLVLYRRGGSPFRLRWSDSGKPVLGGHLAY